MKCIYYSALCALLVAATSCSSDEIMNEDTPALELGQEISFNAIHPSQTTRVTDTGFESGDQMGVYLTTANAALVLAGNELNNAAFTYDGSSWKAARTQYWNAGTYDVYAYYPYATEVNDTEDYLFTVSTDQSTEAGYSSSDFLWASAKGVTASASPVSLQFSHSLANVLIKLEKSEDYEGEIPTDCEAYVHNTYTQAVIDLSSGGAAKYSDSDVDAIKAKKLSTDSFTACVVPQRIESRRPLVEVITQGVSYLLEGTISFKQGMRTTIVVTLTKNPTQTKIEIGGTINGWN